MFRGIRLLTAARHYRQQTNKLTNQLTKFMEQEINGTPAIQKKFPQFINPEISLPCLQEPVTSLCPEPETSNPLHLILNSSL
jgi:hypothetical protein